MENTCVAVNIIKRARKQKEAACLIARELEYVLNHADLHNLDKLIWSKVATRSAEDPSLTCTLFLWELARLFRSDVIDVFKSLARLKQFGFLLVAFNVHVSRFENISAFMKNVGIADASLGELSMPDNLLMEDVKSVHCVLVLPNSGLIEVMEKRRA